jgi:Protein of unknown function (DUF3592)
MKGSGLLWLVVLIFGGMLYWANYSHQVIFQQAQNWPIDRGIVSRVTTESSYRSRRYGSSTRYKVEVDYSYDVNGRTYVGKQSQFLDRNFEVMPGLNLSGGFPLTVDYLYWWNDSNAIQAQFPKNTACAVYYDPADPSRSVIDKNVGSFSMLTGQTWAIGALIMGLCGVLYSASGLSKMR